ncbi:zinc-binding dehydrogenase [Amycolatopsis nigrescens]|uniref:zinc-binding dehydrogenase n=1 Tax=Amycolatopsis nigrescens TaxID=381445 RepID=UPI000363647F|nr:zinc-binding dehydrogenase [Amycolatopsis nigrescens]
MRAVWLHEFGGPEVLVPGEAPDPVAGPGQVVIEVAFVNVTFVETQFRASGQGPFRPELPMIPGNGVGGVISAIGDGVDPGLLGKRVVSSLRGSGGYAERVAVDAGQPVEVPGGLDLDLAVALLADGRTASMLVDRAGLTGGERVLVEAAAGGVGSVLVQLAKAAGATVVAAAGGAHKLELAADLGAEHVVDYRKPDWTDRVREAVGGVDVVFDGVGGEIGAAAFELVERGGRMFSYGLASGSWAEIPEAAAEARGVTVGAPAASTPEELRGFVQSALAKADAGALRPVIGQRFSLDKAADAHAAIASRGTVGKTLLVP